LENDRDKFPRPEHVSAAPDPDDSGPPSLIPEEASEIYELVEEEPALPPPPPSPAPPAPPLSPAPAVPDFPEEALREIRALRSKLDHKDKQIEQVMEAYRSKKAETEKLRKRIEKTERRRFEQSKGDFIARFVEVLDNLDRAIDSIENAFDPDSVLQGIMLVRSRLVQLLKEEGLEKIFVRGQIFDPMNSEAAGMEVVADESQDGVVLRELQPGYMLKGSLLRVARVVVGRLGGEQPAPAAPADAPVVLVADPSEGVTETRSPELPVARSTPAAADPHAQEDQWEADRPGHDLEFSEDGFDFSSD
jgi:molecular chaperone GrpE